MVTASVRRAGAAVATERIVHPRVGTGEGPGAEIGGHGTEVAIGGGVDPEIGTGGLEAETGKEEKTLIFSRLTSFVQVQTQQIKRSLQEVPQ